jgi:glycosyltransferase involved in cell wall biosynthesis
MNSKLAIVIPAYKNQFFKETLESIANQTCKDFTLYIGDDASPYDLYSTIHPFREKFRLVYTRFSSNLGGSDLAEHWNRCIDLINDEEWLWLFSDLMAPDNVEMFYKCIKEFPQENLLHMDVQVVDDKSMQILKNKPFPERLSTIEFFDYRIRSKINSYVIEYIFRKQLYLENGKFESFDLGWCADDATWIKFSTKSGIKTIQDTCIKWRYSGSNISSNIYDKDIILRKLCSTLRYIKWANNFFSEKNLVDTTTNFDKLKVVLSLINSSSFSLRDKCVLAFQSIKELGYADTKPFVIPYLLYMYLKGKLINSRFHH